MAITTYSSVLMDPIMRVCGGVALTGVVHGAECVSGCDTCDMCLCPLHATQC